MVAPRQTTPTLMKNSPWIAGFIHSGTLRKFLTINPKTTEKKTASNP